MRHITIINLESLSLSEVDTLRCLCWDFVIEEGETPELDFLLFRSNDESSYTVSEHIIRDKTMADKFK